MLIKWLSEALCVRFAKLLLTFTTCWNSLELLQRTTSHSLVSNSPSIYSQVYFQLATWGFSSNLQWAIQRWLLSQFCLLTWIFVGPPCTTFVASWRATARRQARHRLISKSTRSHYMLSVLVIVAYTIRQFHERRSSRVMIHVISIRHVFGKLITGRRAMHKTVVGVTIDRGGGESRPTRCESWQT